MTKVSKQDLYSMFDTEVDLSTEDKMKEIENQQNEQKKKETKVNPKDLKNEVEDEDLYEEIDDELEEDDDDLEEDDDDLDDDLDDEEEDPPELPPLEPDEELPELSLFLSVGSSPWSVVGLPIVKDNSPKVSSEQPT